MGIQEESMNMLERTIKDIEKYGKKAKGKGELLKHLIGKKLSRAEAIIAMCYACNGYYADGKCGCSIATCPLYNFMPYRKRAV